MREKTTNEVQTIIGPSVKVEGDFNGEGDLVIEGHFTGSIKTKHNIQIGKDAVIKANIEADIAHISGTVTGDISVKSKILLTKSAKLEGNLACQTLQIEEGAFFNGQSQMQNPHQESSLQTPEH